MNYNQRSHFINNFIALPHQHIKVISGKKSPKGREPSDGILKMTKVDGILKMTKVEYIPWISRNPYMPPNHRFPSYVPNIGPRRPKKT